MSAAWSSDARPALSVQDFGFRGSRKDAMTTSNKPLGMDVGNQDVSTEKPKGSFQTPRAKAAHAMPQHDRSTPRGCQNNMPPAQKYAHTAPACANNLSLLLAIPGCLPMPHLLVRTLKPFQPTHAREPFATATTDQAKAAFGVSSPAVLHSSMHLLL